MDPFDSIVASNRIEILSRIAFQNKEAILSLSEVSDLLSQNKDDHLIVNGLKMTFDKYYFHEICFKDLPEETLFTLIEKYAGDLIHNENLMFTCIYRHIYTRTFGWSIPSREATDSICQFIGTSSVLEIGAGKGLWAAILKCKGIDIIATSIIDGLYCGEDDMQETFTDIEHIDCIQAIDKYPHRDCLFVVWGSGILLPAVTLFKGHKVIVIGEDEHGCTDYLSEDHPIFKYQESIKIPKWQGLWDKVRLYQRR